MCSGGGGEHAPLLVHFCFHSFICSCPQKYAKQESIPLGCVPSAAVAISRAGRGGLCLGGCLPRGSLPRQVSTWGVCLGGLCLGRCLHGVFA